MDSSDWDDWHSNDHDDHDVVMPEPPHPDLYTDFTDTTDTDTLFSDTTPVDDTPRQDIHTPIPEEPLALDEPFDDSFDEPDQHPVEYLIGIDPDNHPSTDDHPWVDHPFPPPLTFDHPPEPIDGFPWSDPNILSAPTTTATTITTWLPPPAADLATYAGLDLSPETNSWDSLLASDDPAISTLARWWAHD